MGRKDKPPEKASPQSPFISTQLRQNRQMRGISLTEMAKRLGYTKGYLSGMENGTLRVSKELVDRYKLVIFHYDEA